MVVTTCEIIWLCWLLGDMGVHIYQTTPLYWDNKSAILISKNSIFFHERMKHIEIDCHFTRHHFHNATISLKYVLYTLQITDMFTKALSAFCFHFLLANSQCLLLSHCEFEGCCQHPFLCNCTFLHTIMKPSHILSLLFISLQTWHDMKIKRVRLWVKISAGK